jgi:hypothetical protein
MAGMNIAPPKPAGMPPMPNQPQQQPFAFNNNQAPTQNHSGGLPPQNNYQPQQQFNNINNNQFPPAPSTNGLQNGPTNGQPAPQNQFPPTSAAPIQPGMNGQDIYEIATASHE